MTLTGAKILVENQFVEKELSFDGEKFCETIGEKRDLTGKYIVPGLIDRHTHGAYNVDFNWATEKDIEKVLSFYESQGVTSVYPTILSDSFEVTCKQLDFVASMMEKYPIIKGIHLEGPFLSPEYKGAMPPEYLKTPDIALFDKFFEASHKQIKIITIAPELDGACELIAHAKDLGVVVSIGHTSATFNEAIRGIDAGATIHTHFMNACRLETQHECGDMGAVYFDDRISIEQIVDGRHIWRETAMLNYKIKGPKRFCLITDSIMATGLPDGRYKLGVNDIDVIEGDAVLAENHKVRAGSTLTMIQAVKNASDYCKIPMAEAFCMGSIVPARVQNIDDKVGSLEIGKQADFLILDKDFNILETYINGKKVYDKVVGIC